MRPRKQLALLGFAFFLCLWIISWFGLLGELEVSLGAEPIRLELHGLRYPDQITATYVTTTGDADGDAKQFGFVIPHEELMFPSADRATWRIAGHWIQTLHITAPPSVLGDITQVEVMIGTRRQTHSLNSWKPVNPSLTGLLPNRSQPAITVELPAVADASLPAINSKPLGEHVHQLFLFPLVGFVIALLAAWMLLRLSPHGSLPESSPLVTESPAWFLAGLALSAAGIGVLFAKYSYPFTQDDNFSQFLPLILYNCRTLLAGHWPAWNPHQFLGAPVATMGIYSVTYPPLYLAFGLAKFLGNELLTIEIYTLLHLAAGYALLHQFLRTLSIRASLCALAAASFVLSGWFLIAARSQMTFAPLAVWPVAMAWSLHHIAHHQPTWKWTLLTGLSVGLFFHAGHSQMWVYAMLFYAAGIAVYWIAGLLTARRVAQALSALVIGIGIAAPLLILQAVEGTSSARSGAYGDRIEFLHMLLPLGSLFPRPMGLGSGGYEYFCEMYYSGTLFQALSFAALLMAIARFVLKATTQRELKTWLGNNVWLVLWCLALLFGLGSKGILWTLFAQLPLFDRFRWPIKFAYFCLLYSTLAGAILAERLLTLKPKLQYPVLAAVAGLLLFHATLSRTSWYDFADRPYPPLPALMEPAVHNPKGRLLTRWGSMDRSPLPGFYNTLPLDFATQAGAYAIGGYDTFLEGSLAARRVRYKFWQDPVGAARAYGVQWIAEDRTLAHPVASANPFFSSLDAPSVGNVLAIHAAQDAGHSQAQENGLTLHQLDGSAPLAFNTREPNQALGIEFTAAGATIDTSTARRGDTIVANIAMRPWMTGPLKLEGDDWGRVQFQIPAELPRVALTYRPPWPMTTLCGLVLVLTGLAGARYFASGNKG